MSEGYTVLRIDEVEPIQAIAEPFQIRLLRRRLGVQAFGVNAYTAPAAGDQVIEDHDELGGGAARHEELYLVVSGKATFTVDGKAADIGPGGIVFVADPASRRAAVAAEPDTTVLVVGGTPGEVNRAGGWEHNVLANPAYLAGDYDEAIRIAEEGLAEQPENAGLLYNLACFQAMAGRGDEAVDLLRRAYDVEPSARDWATDDSDLDSIRGREDFPGVKSVVVTDIEPRRIIGGTMLWHPVRRTLGVRSFGTNAYTALNAGDRVVEEHTEGGAKHEELYLVLNGSATFELGDDTAEVAAGGMVFISDPGLKRGAVANEANTTVIVFGGPAGEPYEPQVWEYDFAAQEPYDAGDFEAAYEIASEGLEEHSKSARLHYNLACYAARGNHQELALHHIDQATKLDADLVRTWSADDHDLDLIRERAGL